MSTAFDPSVTSRYVDDAFYDALMADFTGWPRDGALVGDAGERAAVEALLAREARLLDRRDYRAWLALFVPECLYWAPGTPEPSDPRESVAVFFDDRRRLEDRIYRLETGWAWSQVPPSRTVHMISNVEVFRARDPGRRMVRANFCVHEFRAGETRALAGWLGYRLAMKDGGPLIEVKQVNLLECDQNLRNLSIVL